MDIYSILKAEIDSNPIFSENGIRKPDAEILALGNAPSDTLTKRTEFGRVKISVIMNKMAGFASGTISKLLDAQNNTALPSTVRSVARLFNLWSSSAAAVTGRDYFDLDSPEINGTQEAPGAIQVFQSIGAITEPETVLLLALADVPIGIFENLIGRPATLDDIERSH